MNIEIWKDIKGFEGKYQISNFGNVKNLNYYRKGIVKILKPIKHNSGYNAINLSFKGKNKQYLIHRLVAETFIPNPNKYEFVNHKDENKRNNKVENLEWCTKSYNAIYYLNFDEKRKEEYAKRFRDKKTGESLSSYTKHIPKKNFEKVNQYDLDGKLIKHYENPTLAALETNAILGNIISCCKRNVKPKRKKKCTCNGYIWEYAGN